MLQAMIIGAYAAGVIILLAFIFSATCVYGGRALKRWAHRRAELRRTRRAWRDLRAGLAHDDSWL